MPVIAIWQILRSREASADGSDEELAGGNRECRYGESFFRNCKRGSAPFLAQTGGRLTASDEANEEMTLVFNYPVAVGYEGYLRQQIKIEFGRGDQQPSQRHRIGPYAAEEFPEVPLSLSRIVEIAVS